MKYFKIFALTLLYIFIYMFFMLFTQVVFGLTIGGAGREIIDSVRQGAQPDSAALQEIADHVLTRLNDYLRKNTGIIYSISALISLLAFIRIYKMRRIELFPAIQMKGMPSTADMRQAIFTGASANFIVVMLMTALQSTNLLNEAFARYESYVDFTFGTGGLPATLLGFAFIAPLVEEILFRGMITRELKGGFPLTAAIIIQGVLFGLFHLEPIQIIYAIPLGIYLGFIAYKSSSLWPAIAAHASMNFVSVIIQTPGLQSAFQNNAGFVLFFAGTSVFLFIYSLTYFIKKKPAQIAPE